MYQISVGMERFNGIPMEIFRLDENMLIPVLAY